MDLAKPGLVVCVNYEDVNFKPLLLGINHWKSTVCSSHGTLEEREREREEGRREGEGERRGGRDRDRKGWCKERESCVKALL